jgi:hypothetical protein
MSSTTTGAPTPGTAAVQPADPANRDLREIIRDEQIMRQRVLAVIADEAHSIPEIAAALGRPAHEVTYWVMGLRKYGWVREEKEVNDEGYFVYQAVEREI